ncbi:MAG: B12-binding domain-containing radical SAM protein [Nitrospirae bacterium]|nr:B12-binding domain-containing radical SAM protein [Nitrospirota bacterium]
MANLGKNSSADIILLYPKTGLDIGGHTVAPPHSSLAVAAPVHNAGYKVKIVDMRRDANWQGTIKQSLSSDTICVGVTTMTGTQVFFAIMMASYVRHLTGGKIPIVWGGPHPTILPEQTLQNENVDIVVVGEGDVTFLELVKALEKKQPLDGISGIAFKNGGGVTITPPKGLLDVNTLLPVPWDLINVEDYITPDNYFLKGSPRTLDVGQTSRGCPHRCGFCLSSSILQKKWRPMTIDRAMDIILEPVKKYKLTGIWVRDDEFYVSPKRAFTICENIVNSGHNILWYATGSRVDDFNRFTDENLELLKRSGAQITKFGAESGNNRILDLIQKGFHIEDTIKANLRCKKHGIIPAYSLIIGFPTETIEEINNTINFGFRLRRDNPSAQLETMPTYTAFPCTPMYDLALSLGLRPPDRLEGWADWILDDYDLEGRQIPWFNRRQRLWIGNISYLSILAHAIGNVAGGIENKFWRAFFSSVLVPMQSYYRWRLKHKFYKRLPELRVARYLRKKIFYRSSKMIK